MKYIFGLLMLALTFVLTSPPCFAIQDVPITENTSIEKKVTDFDTVASIEFEVEKIAEIKGALPEILTFRNWNYYEFPLSNPKKNISLQKTHYFAWNDSYLCNFVTTHII